MDNSRKIRRVCKFCGKTFELTKSQLRQVEEKWPINCGRSCARKAQHARNHGDKRIDIECEGCGEVFQAVKWEIKRGKKYCNSKCYYKSRFGEPKERRKKLNKKISAILRDEKYMAYLKGKAKYLGLKYGVDPDDIIQDYFLHLLEGHNSFIEQTSMSIIRKEYNRGVCGKWKAKADIIDAEGLKFIKDKVRFLESNEFKEYLIDIKSVTTKYEYKVIELAILGFGRNDSNEITYGGNEKFSKTWNKFIKPNLL